MADPKPFDPVIITWVDAESDSTAQHESPQAALDAYKPATRKTIGFWVGRTPKGICIADTDDRKDDAPNSLGGVTWILTGMFQRIQPLYIAPPAKRKR
jgi:hypothetical protein